MSVTIMMDGSRKPNHMLGFELPSSHATERRYNMYDFESWKNKRNYYYYFFFLHGGEKQAISRSSP